MIEITNRSIDIPSVLDGVRDEQCGASVLFLGTTRTDADRQPTESLEYECYESMARQALAELERQALQRWPIRKCFMVHRVGVVGVGEASIAIAVSSPHRSDAFAAGQWLIDSVKHRVPIWKKEIRTDGSAAWQHPLSQTGAGN